MPRETPLRAGVLGTGAVARLHAEALAVREDADLVAVADHDPARAAEFAARHGGAVFDDLDAMLAGAGLDVLHLCTPPQGHADQARAAFAAGCDVVIEKPPALSLAELDAIAAAAETAGRRFAVVFQQRTGTGAAHVKRLLDSGALGRPRIAVCHTLWSRGAEYYAVPWRGTWADEGGGTSLGHGIHQLDLLAFLLGEWERARGEFWRLDRDIETEDLAIGTVEFASRAVASVVTSVLAVREESAIRIDADRATIELRHLYGHGHAHWRITPAPGVDPAEVAGWALPEIEVASGHAAYLDAVYPSFRAGTPLPPVAAAPARGLELVTALYASARRDAGVSRAELADPALRGALSAPIRSWS